MNPLPKRQESNEAANPRLHQAFMSPLMIALPASSTHTQDMFDQLRTAAELELIEITAFIQDKLGFNISTRFLKIIKKGRRSQQSMHRQCCDDKDSSEKKKDFKKNKNTKSSLRKSSEENEESYGLLLSISHNL